MAIIGYARVSSIGQKLDVQLEKLQTQGCEKIYREKESASTTTKRPWVTLQVIDQNIDTSSSTGRLMFNMLATIAQFETEIRAERQMDGIKKAKANGVVFGRVKTLNSEQVTELKSKRQSGILIKDLMAEYKLSKKSIYNYLELANVRVQRDVRIFKGGERAIK